MKKFITRRLAIAMLAGCAAVAAPTVRADGELPAPVQAKTEQYKKKLAEWAANPVIIAAVKEVNASGGLAGMTNGKWNDLDDKDPVVKAFETNKAGALIKKWEEDPAINKLVLRDAKGNLVASSAKPLVYNNGNRPVFVNTAKGQVWAAAEIKPDPTTGIKSVQAGAPVIDAGKVIGVIHAGITAD